MAFNEYMHPRNPYNTPPDFKNMAEHFPEFKKYVICQKSGKYRVDFKDPFALRALTKALLKKDFNLDIEIPENSIIPTIPQRLNYILWIEDLLAKLSQKGKVVKGIDIGTGPSCIFSFLGFRKNGWQFIATEVNEESIKWAEQNIKRNNLQDFIKIKKVSEEMILKEVVTDSKETFDFCLCNPPFFEDIQDQRKKNFPHAPQFLEIIVDGGEVSFVKKIIDDSLVLKEQIRIYSSMLGKKKSVKEITDVLENIEGVIYTTTSFCQGNTMRWGVAWTFLQIPSLKTDTTPKKKLKKKKGKRPLSFVFPQSDLSVKDMVIKIKSILDDLKIVHRDIYLSNAKASLQITSNQNTWTGQRRKRRELQRQTEEVPSLNSCSSEDSSKLDTEQARLDKDQFQVEAQSNSGLALGKRKSNETDPENNKCKKNCDRNVLVVDDSPSGSVQRNAVNASEKLILNCNIRLTKLEENVIFQMVSDSDSNLENMHQVYQLFHNKLNRPSDQKNNENI